ncbi:hypothetical protein UPYG_G00084070 [Umbra pygmaea]|uniref:C2H2-type domain-containing protein n=1 Tax=Umbra pygmaea TaxID=75934 RepID=A0ABD0XVW6_UMBPY
MNSGQSFYGTFSGVHLEPGSSSGGSEALLNKDSDSPSFQQQQGSLHSLGGLGSSKAPCLTSTQGPAKDSSTLPKQGGRTEGPPGKEVLPRGEVGEIERREAKVRLASQDQGSEEEDEPMLEDEEDELEGEGSALSCVGNSSSAGGEVGEPAVSNQSISKSPLLMPSSTLQPSGCPSAASPMINSKAPPPSSSFSVREECGIAADGGGRTLEHPLSFNCQGSMIPMAMAAAADRGGEDDAVGTSSPLALNDAADESANRDSAIAPEPNDCLVDGDEDNGALLHHHHLHHHHHHLHSSSHSHTHPGGSCDMGGMGECPQNHGPGGSGGSGVECPKCDTVLGSSRSLGGHMTMMHSRNSCKTLKCPKCNWHYKYQQTLEAHMKEKHPDSGGSCVYCSSGQSHPRLARGESYTCGYKPFRCEVCNYSTTTKGNLSIHMQSDKHLNNMQTLQNGGSVNPAEQQVFGQHPGGVGVVSVPSVTQASTHHAPHHHHPTQSSAHMAVPWRPAPPSQKQLPRVGACEVCDHLRPTRAPEPAHPHDQREAHAQHDAAPAECHADAARPAWPGGNALSVRG